LWLPLTLDKTRYHDLDALRSCAMLLGIVIHGLLSFMPIPLPMVPQDINQNPEIYGYIFNFIHGFRMQLFFLISGFFTAMLWRKQGLRSLLKHRAKRILFPLIIFAPMTGILMIAVMLNYAEFPVSGVAVDKFSELTSHPFGFLIVGIVFPVTGHLWFLYYLIWLILGFVAVVKLNEKLKVQPISTTITHNPWLWLIPITFFAQLLNGLGGIGMGVDVIGPDTFGGLIPWPPQLIYYGVFFGFGALCYRRGGLGQINFFRWQTCFIFSIPALLLAMHWIVLRNASFKAGWDGNQLEIIWYHFLTNLFQVFYVWLMIFGFINFFKIFFSEENKRVRYLSDASYWIYIMHMPLIVILQFWVKKWPYPSIVKFLFICILAVGFLLVIYEYAIRYTWVGTILNGKRVRVPSEA